MRMRSAVASVRRMTKDQCRDTGMALVLLLLIFSIALKRNELVLDALVLQVITMTVPRIFAPIAVVWLGLSHLLGAVMSRVILTVIFFLVVTPIGLVRRLLGKDPLRLRAFNASDDSVMLPRNHIFSGADLERPY
jgi:hypothetical protein